MFPVLDIVNGIKTFAVMVNGVILGGFKGSPGAMVVSGKHVTLDGTWFDNSGDVPPPNSSALMEWLIDGASLGSGYLTGPPFTWTWDTTQVADGTHAIGARWIDSTGPLDAYHLQTRPAIVIVNNMAVNNGEQRVPVTGLGYNVRIDPQMPDFVNYPGAPQSNIVRPYPTQFIPPSKSPALRDASQWYREATTGGRYWEYMSAPQFQATLLGGVFVQGYLAQAAITLEGVYSSVIHHNNMDGGRNDNMIDPYSNAIGGPDGYWYGVDVAGRVWQLKHDGTVTTIAGPKRNRATLPYDYNDLSITEQQLAAKYTIVGTISGFGDFSGANDLCFDPRNSNILYVAKTLDHIIIKIDLSQNPPAATLYAGQDGVAGYVDGASDVALFNEPYSICMQNVPGHTDPIGTMYIADQQNSAIRTISPDGKTVSTMAGGAVGPTPPTLAAATANAASAANYSPPGTLPFTSAYMVFPQFLRMTSAGKIVLGEAWSQTVRVIDPNARTVARVGTFGDIQFGDSGNTWMWGDVDTLGTCGPVDDIVFAKSDSAPGSAATIWRLSLDGTYSAQFGGDSGLVPEGPYGPYAGGGHYPWVFAFSKTQARFLSMGFADTGVFSWRSVQPSDPAFDYNNSIGFDNATYTRGQNVFIMGTCPIFPWNSRPGFRALVGASGSGHLGSSVVPNFDDLMAHYPSNMPGDAGDQALAAFIQSGMGGSVPRPEITGNALRDLIYYIRRSSLAGSYPTIVNPGPDNADTTPPVISNVVATRTGPTTFAVTWQTDKPTMGLAACGTVANVYTVWSPIEASFGTSHTVTINGAPTASPQHFAVLSKDAAGNSAVSPDATIV
jgi:hypothetical protein